MANIYTTVDIDVDILNLRINCLGKYCINTFTFILKTIDSILSQKFEDWRLLIVDDDSRDAARRRALNRIDEDPLVVGLERDELEA